VAINCGGLPEALFESELFGHEPGAFTSAAKRRIGKLEHANGGTLLLDEIETMPITLQIKLLRILQERRIERLGSNEEVPINVRFIAATKADLLKGLSEANKFRGDLYYRLNVATLCCRRCASGARTSRCCSSTSSRRPARATSAKRPS
jgi:two-component system C4-dicarboxylate transport response regulator DctD